MSTIRVSKRHRFTTVDRRTINDERLSLRARGLIVWLLDKPNDWTINSRAIAERTTEGRDAIRAALRELEEAGYVERLTLRDRLGRFSQEVVIHEVAGAWKSGAGESGAGEPGANTKTDTEDCYPQTPSRCIVCGGNPKGGACLIQFEHGPGSEEACPWKEACWS